MRLLDTDSQSRMRQRVAVAQRSRTVSSNLNQWSNNLIDKYSKALIVLPVNGRFAVDREFVYIAVPLLKHFVGASWCKLAIWVSLGPSWVSLG